MAPRRSGTPLIDAAGTVHRPVAAEEARLVSLVPSLTETLFDLGLGGRVVGRTAFCVHPGEGVRDLPSVGGPKEVDLERLLALAPTHVLVNMDETPRKVAAAIAAAGIPVVVTNPLKARENPALYRLLGGLFGREGEAEELAAVFEAALASLTEWAEGRAPRRVVYLIWKNPWMTVSRDTYLSSMLSLVKWQTLGHDPGVRYPTLEITGEILAECDLVLFASEPYPFRERHLEEFARAYDCRGQELSVIDGEMLSWYGSRAIRGLEYLRRFAARHT